jgi:hypothetical protein
VHFCASSRLFSFFSSVIVRDIDWSHGWQEWPLHRSNSKTENRHWRWHPQWGEL